MNRDRFRNGKPVTGSHALVTAEPDAAHPLGRLALVITLALVAGIAVGVIWLAQTPRGNLEMLPEAIAEATRAATLSATAAAPTPAAVTPAPDIVADAAAANSQQPVIAGEGAALIAEAPALPPMPVLRAQLAQVTVLPPSPTPTSTPRPVRAEIEVVIGVGGAAVWDGASGLQIGQLPQGALVTATARSEDGAWLRVNLPEGGEGWIATEGLIAFDLTRLAVQPVVIIPITPTPVRPGAEVAAVTPLPGGVPPAAAPEASKGGIALPTPTVDFDGPTARVTLQNTRLNLRAGPGSSYAIVAKAEPGMVLGLVARDRTGQWLQVMLPNGQGFGWGVAEYLAADVEVQSLPVSDAAGAAPASVGDGSGSAPVSTPTNVPVNVPSSDSPYGAPVPIAPPVIAPGELAGKLAIQARWGGDIYIYDLATGDLRLLTGGFDPSFSPDGQQVAFTRAGGEHGLYLINVDGSNERLIFSGRELLRSPKWSPDGQYIVFERGDEVLRCERDDAGRCYPPLNPDRERQQKLARVDYNGQNYQDIPVLERARVPDWNSAGIVYQSPAGLQITQDAPGAKSELLFFNIQKQYELDPDWQPNGGRVIFQRRENDHWEIYSVAADGSGLKALTFPVFTLVEKLPSNVAPAWSPDGRYIVYLSNNTPSQSAGDWRVWVMDAEGGNKRPLPIALDFVYTYVAEQMLDWGR